MLFFLTFLFIKESWKSISFHKNYAAELFSTLVIIINIYWAANQHITDFWRSCDTEDWSNDAENTAAVTEINYSLKFIKI